MPRHSDARGVFGDILSRFVDGDLLADLLNCLIFNELC